MGSEIVAEPPRMVALADLLRALAKFSPLPRRTGAFVEIEEGVFMLALKDERGHRAVVAAIDLEVAANRIVQGSLGHGFHPSPPELRRICEEVRDERLADVNRRLGEQRLLRDMEERRVSRHSHTPEERDRVRRRAEEVMRDLGASPIDPRMKPRG